MNLLAAVPLLYRWLMLLALAVALYFAGWVKGHMGEAAKLDQYVASVKALGDAQTAKVKEINAQQQQNLTEVTHDLLANVQAAGTVAVDNYRDRYGVQQCPGRGAVPEPAASEQSHDGTASEPVATEQPTDAFVKACAHDAAILDSWQSWATLNHIPIQ